MSAKKLSNQSSNQLTSHQAKPTHPPIYPPTHQSTNQPTTPPTTPLSHPPSHHTQLANQRLSVCLSILSPPLLPPPPPPSLLATVPVPILYVSQSASDPITVLLKPLVLQRPRPYDASLQYMAVKGTGSSQTSLCLWPLPPSCHFLPSISIPFL